MMPFLDLIALSALAIGSGAAQSHGLDRTLSGPPIIWTGWHDEMGSRYTWKPLDMANRAFVAAPTPGQVFLGLDTVPKNWPYTYQWSGVQQKAQVDVAKYPVVSAYVP